MSASGVVLRSYGDEDHDRTFVWLQEPQLRRLLGTTAAPTPETHRAWIERMRNRSDVILLAVDHEARHVGNLYLVDVDRLNLRAEVQLFLGGVDDRDHGVGSVALVRARELAFGDLGLHRLYAYVFEYNPRAVRAFEKAGFRVEGRLRDHQRRDGRFSDTFVLGYLVDDV